jgi:spore coat protein A, manganese oxidase
LDEQQIHFKDRCKADYSVPAPFLFALSLHTGLGSTNPRHRELITRRTFLERLNLLAAGLWLNPRLAVAKVLASRSLDPDRLAHFVDPLPIPEIIRHVARRPGPDDPSTELPFYRMVMQELHSKVHRDLPPTRVWGFNNSSPGPIFETRSGEGLLVEWVNQLPGRHFLPIDHNLHGAEVDQPKVRTVIHLHGGRTPPGSDGWPESWFVPGKSAICHYPNRQNAALLFYHDHTMGINRLNIYAGLQGLFIIRDATEESLKLPKGPYEIPLLLYDRFLRADGQLEYPVSENPKSPWVPEVYSNCMLANGKLFPYVDVEPRKYRLRVMNGSNGRFFRLSLGKGIDLHQIGSDQGLLSAPVTTKRILLAPAERADIVVDFSGHAGEKLILQSDSFEILQFRVAARTTSPDTSALPVSLRSVRRIAESEAVRTRRLTLDENMDMVQQSMGMLLNKTPWHMPVTEKPIITTTEIWELVNLTEDSHPIHLHLVRFQLLDRRPFDVFHYQDKEELRFTGPLSPATPGEAGWKDTIRADPGEVTRIIVPFEGYTGRYVWHCHLLEHEDNEMMRPFEVVPAESRSADPDKAK